MGVNIHSLTQQRKEISGGKPLTIKGIQSVADAKKYIDVGLDSMVISNHAGRQVDCAIASLDALEDIVNAGLGEKFGLHV